MTTVSNTTPLISLSSIGKINLLQELFGEIVVSQAVYSEIKAKKSNLEVVRTLSILVQAKARGLIPALKPLLDEMILKGRWYSRNVYEQCLERVNEL